MKLTQHVNPYVLGTQKRTVESAEPDTKHPSLDSTDVKTQTSEVSILTQHLSLKSDFIPLPSNNLVHGKTTIGIGKTQ